MVQPCTVSCAVQMTNNLHAGDYETTDWNNALKLGFDAHTLSYAPYLLDQPWSHLLPRRVLQPGDPVATITPDAAERTGLPAGCQVEAGTTDSIAAFLAAGVEGVGDAVSSLGSTLAVKMLSAAPVEDAACGLYSHRLGARGAFERLVWHVAGFRLCLT
jgi:D-ribulokinase